MTTRAAAAAAGGLPPAPTPAPAPAAGRGRGRGRGGSNGGRGAGATQNATPASTPAPAPAPAIPDVSSAEVVPIDHVVDSLPIWRTLGVAGEPIIDASRVIAQVQVLGGPMVCRALGGMSEREMDVALGPLVTTYHPLLNQPDYQEAMDAGREIESRITDSTPEYRKALARAGVAKCVVNLAQSVGLLKRSGGVIFLPSMSDVADAIRKPVPRPAASVAGAAPAPQLEEAVSKAVAIQLAALQEKPGGLWGGAGAAATAGKGEPDDPDRAGLLAVTQQLPNMEAGARRTASQRAGSSGKGKGKKRRMIQSGDEEYRDDQPSCSVCGSSNPGKFLECGFCTASSHGWCVNLRDEDFLPGGRHSLFDKFACPDCFEGGKRSTRSGISIVLTSSIVKSEDSDLGGSAEALWDLVTTSVPQRVEWTCRMAMMSVRGLNLEDKRPHLETYQLLDLIVSTLHYLMIPMGEDQLVDLFDFHTTLALRFLEASCPQMRLWGLKQMGGLVALAQRHCWSPKAVSVDGAGSKEVDGVYRVSPADEENPPPTAYFVSAKTHASSMPPRSRTPTTYTHEGGGHVLSRSKNAEGRNTWHISRLVPRRGGRRRPTKIECYSFQAPSPAETMVRPCGSGWEEVAHDHEDLDPPPFVTPKTDEGYLCPEGDGEKSLEWKLAQWIIRNKVVNKIFEEPTWPADVNGSIKELLRFMARMEGARTPDQISLIWCSVVKMGPEFKIAANNVLVRLALDVTPELVIHLLRGLQQGVAGHREWGAWKDVLVFLVQLVDNPGHRLLGRFEGVREATAELVWSLLEKSEVLLHESCQLVSTLLTSVVYTSEKTLNDQRDLQRFLERCINSWRTSSELRDSVSIVRHMLDNSELKHIRQLVQLFDTGHNTANANPEPNRAGAGEGEAKSQEKEQERMVANPKQEGAEAGTFADTLRQECCAICGQRDLLDNAGTDMFGVVSWRCRCPIRRKAHSRCVLTHVEMKNKRRTPCPTCRSDMSFGKERESTRQRLSLQLHNPPDDAVLTEDDYEPPSDDDDRNDSDFEI